MRLSGCLGLLVLLATVSPGRAAPVTSVDQLCTGDPCVVSGGFDIAPGMVLDFKPRAVRITQSGRLAVGDGDTLTIQARSVTMEPGAIIRGPLIVSAGPTIRLEATQDIVIQRNDRSRARIDAHGQASGGVIVLGAGGNVDLAGDLRADGTTSGSDGGAVDITATGAVTMTGEIQATGGIESSGGTVTVESGGALLAAAIDLSGGSDGGIIEMRSGAALTTAGFLNVTATAAGGLGGEVTLESVAGSVVVGGRIAASGGLLSLADDGSGGDVDIAAAANVQVNERIEVSAGGPDGGAGSIGIDAGVDLTLSQPLVADVTGATAIGGDVDLTAGGVLTLAALIDVHGFAAGNISGQGGSSLLARAEINADGEAGQITLMTLSGSRTQVGPVTVSGNLHAQAPAGSVSGSVAIEGCDLTVDAAGRLVTGGSKALNVLQASGQMTIAGQVVAGPPGTNRFEYASLPPVIAAGALVDPPATQQVAALRPCLGPEPDPMCGNSIIEPGETCDDGNAVDCDGCDATCVLEACGDGNFNALCTTEQCDDGNVNDGDGCDANCTRTGCGNGRVTAGEECDDGNQTSGDGCDFPACHVESPKTCGDGVVDAGEECDDKNTADCDGCSHLCLSEGCGNNRTECAEVCDAGNALDCDGDGCAHDCLSQETCGDAKVCPPEECDKGADKNSKPGSACNAFCRVCALGTGDCPCGADTDCHPFGKCGGFQCNSAGICVPFPVPPCDDHSVCTGVEACVDGACVFGTPLRCVSGDLCILDSCDAVAGCQRAPVTGLRSVSCRVETFRLTLAAASADDVPAGLRKKLDKAANKLQVAVDAAAAGGDDPKRLGRLLKVAQKRAKKVLGIVRKATNKLPPTLAESLRAAADGARAAAEGLRRDLPK